MGKKISELTNRQQLSGNEDLPFQEGQDNGSITIHSLNEYISNSNVNQAINQIKQAEQQAISNFSSQKVSPEMLSESTKQLINASGGGTITNLADDEDIESVGQDLKVLKFADRAYNPDRFSGKGYKIFRRNIIDGKNILTQEMINQPDTIYEIRYDFDLDGAEISIPKGCILKFNGGRFLNALNIKGDVENKYLMPEWFGASNDGKTDSSDAFNAIVRICRSIRCSNKKTYLFTKDIDAKILNELSIDMNMSSFIDFHIVINMNDEINDWRQAYSSIGLSIKEGFIMSKGSDTKYRNWQIPVIISGAPVRLDNISIRRVPYILALADRYIDVMRWHNVIYYSWEDTYSDVTYRLDAINVVLRDIGNIINNRGNGSYKYTIYLLCGENIPIAKRVLNIDITDSDKEKTPYFYINPGKNYGFEIYRESPNGKKEVVVGFSSVNDVETLSFQDFSDCALIGEHDSAWSSMKTSVLLWKPVKDDIPDKTLYPHFFYNQGVLVSTSGNLKSPLTDFLAIPYLNVGVTSQRPGNADNGFQFFDVTLRKPIWWNGSSWVDANGVSV